MERNPVITLTSDFGYRDPSAAIMKGVILDINPLAVIADITHEISLQNIAEAAYVIGTSFQYFPHKTIHVVVVDPGVGSARRPILVVTDYHYFVGPDNGVFSSVYAQSESLAVIHITAEHYFLPRRSSTFHGRDVFAPVAAWLSKGIHLSKFGEPITDYTVMTLPGPASPSQNILEGEVIYIDHFGNLITNIPGQKMYAFTDGIRDGKLKVTVKGIEAPLKRFYSEVPDKQLYSLVNSFGYLELFVNSANAASAYGLTVGDKVTVISPQPG
jgi:hypothetical protein